MINSSNLDSTVLGRVKTEEGVYSRGKPTSDKLSCENGIFASRDKSSKNKENTISIKSPTNIKSPNIKSPYEVQFQEI